MGANDMTRARRTPAIAEITYRGDAHSVVCDGTRHICIPADNEPWIQGPCPSAGACEPTDSRTALVEALEALLGDVLNLGSHSVTSRPSVAQARAAIAKVEGRDA